MPLYYNGAQVKKLYYNGTEVKNGYYNSVKVFSSGPSWYDTLKSMSVGGTISIDNLTWLVVNKTSSAAVLGLNTVYSQTNFHPHNVAYAGSTLASVAANFETNQLSASTKAFLNNVTVNGVTAKVFVPSKAQMDGGFSHYNSFDNRKCQYQGGISDYWTSTPDGLAFVWYVNVAGGIDTNAYPRVSKGFRPHIEVNLTLC